MHGRLSQAQESADVGHSHCQAGQDCLPAHMMKYTTSCWSHTCQKIVAHRVGAVTATLLAKQLTPQHHALLDGGASKAHVCNMPQLMKANLWSPATSVGLGEAVPLSAAPNTPGRPVVDRRTTQGTEAVKDRACVAEQPLHERTKPPPSKRSNAPQHSAGPPTSMAQVCHLPAQMALNARSPSTSKGTLECSVPPAPSSDSVLMPAERGAQRRSR